MKMKIADEIFTTKRVGEALLANRKSSSNEIIKLNFSRLLTCAKATVKLIRIFGFARELKCLCFEGIGKQIHFHSNSVIEQTTVGSFSHLIFYSTDNRIAESYF